MRVSASSSTLSYGKCAAEAAKAFFRALQELFQVIPGESTPDVGGGFRNWLVFGGERRRRHAVRILAERLSTDAAFRHPSPGAFCLHGTATSRSIHSGSQQCGVLAAPPE